MRRIVRQSFDVFVIFLDQLLRFTDMHHFAILTKSFIFNMVF